MRVPISRGNDIPFANGVRTVTENDVMWGEVARNDEELKKRRRERKKGMPPVTKINVPSNVHRRSMFLNESGC